MHNDAPQYFYTSASGRGGPVPFVELRLLAVAGKITRRDEIWCESMTAWQAAETISELFQGLPPDQSSTPRRLAAIPLYTIRQFCRIAMAVVVAGVALEMLTGMFGIRWRVLYWGQKHQLGMWLMVLCFGGVVFCFRKYVVRVGQFLSASDPLSVAKTLKQPNSHLLKRLSGRAMMLLLVLICLASGFGWNSFQQVQARTKWERERPQREAEFKEGKLRSAGNDGFRAGEKLAQQSAVTGVYRVARTEAEIRLLAQEVLNGKVDGVGVLFRVSAEFNADDQWAAWKDGFTEGYVGYMRNVKKRFAPAY